MSNLTGIFFFTLFFTATLYCQDIHYTNYRNVESNFNPASTGNFFGSIKIQGIYRSQYLKTYENMVLGVESNMQSPLNKKHWIGAAINISNDKAGDLNLKTSGGGLGLSYHIPLGKKNKSRVAIGYAINMMTIKGDAANYRSENVILQKDDKDKNLINDFKDSYKSMSGGVVYYNKLNKKTSIETGVAFLHFNAPSFSFKESNTKSAIGSRINIHGKLMQSINPQLIIEPAFYLSFSENQKNINLQLLTDYKINKKNKWSAVAGLSHRMGESIHGILGYKSPSTYITVSYDYLYGDHNNYIGNTGAIELGGYYVITLHKKPKVTPIIICPRL